MSPMAPINLNLVAPSIHHFYSQSYELRDIAPLTGHVILSASSASLLPNPVRTEVKLIQIVTSMGDSKQTRRLSGSTSELIKPTLFSERVLREVHLSFPSRDKEGNSTGTNVSDIPFSIDIPKNIPPTSETPIGSITYAIECTAATQDHGTITHRQPVKLGCHKIWIDSEKTHKLLFPASNDIHGMTLTQCPTPRSGPRISFLAIIHTHWMTAPADRPSEVRYLVVRKLKWQAEEVIKIMSKPVNSDGDYSICERHLVRTLCEGSVKGSWESEPNPERGDDDSSKAYGEGKPAIRIPFGFTIPKRAKVTDDIDLDAYDVEPNGADYSSCFELPRKLSLSSMDAMMLAIVVHHRLKLEFVTGEDVFQRGTGRLVERTRSRTVLCPAVPFSVGEVSN
ncbi:hypothetical protein N7535_003628 [Penicillium sp. DV-2018c]|nr:hypothetical protein N7461_000670 [Penicillium sp. DV-2018c]KAJ5576702.1 hypothetical protein N7535_003628 [Penicillium sp. DV-2018c]